MLPDDFVRYDQQHFGAQPGPDAGDCIRAAVATIIQVDPDTLRNWAADPDAAWHLAMREDLEALGWWFATCPFVDGLTMDDWDKPVVLIGPGPGGHPHAVVGTVDGQLLHDPHPERRGVSRVDQFWVIAPMTEGKVA